MPNIDRDDENATRCEMAHALEVPIDEQTASQRAFVEMAITPEGKRMAEAKLASLERLKRIESAERPIEPDEVKGLGYEDVESFDITTIKNYIDALSAYADRMRAERDAETMRADGNYKLFKNAALAHAKAESTLARIKAGMRELYTEAQARGPLPVAMCDRIDELLRQAKGE